MKSIILSGLVLILIASQLNAQIQQIDVLHYKIDLSVTDFSDTIRVTEDVGFKHTDTQKPMVLNLASLRKDGKGMKVEKLFLNGIETPFLHQNDSLYIYENKATSDDYYELKLTFKGVPIDGLVIGENKHGMRTFFGDNWPNRAHNWFACNDHLSDKASVEYMVHVPQQYTVVANGGLISVKKKRKIKTFHYFSMVPIPTKVMVVGIAKMELEISGSVEGLLIQSFVYPESRKEAFYDLRVAPKILNFYIDYIAPYEFEKLDNVQSTTRFGGMENAGCIFYDEEALNGTLSAENLIAHEIAHQWFGNSATEKDWPHLWLSEGFATYLTNIYVQSTKGDEAFKEQLRQDRARVVRFEKKYQHPVVDFNYESLMDLLNPNSYQKGSWVLHMLRVEVGDELFQKCIQAYYEQYKRSNADTKDLQKIVEEICDKDLDWFFNQWLYRSGHPKLNIAAETDDRKLSLNIQQREGVYTFPLKVAIVCTNGATYERFINISQKNTTKDIVSSYPIKSFVIDPDVDLLFERVK